MNDELEIKVWPPIFRAIGPGDDMVVSAEKLEAYISKNFIKKEDVLEAIEESYEYSITDMELAEHQGKELLLINKSKLKEKLNIGDK